MVNLANEKYATTKTATDNKVEDAMSFDKSIVGKYTVTSDALNMRLGAG